MIQNVVCWNKWFFVQVKVTITNVKPRFRMFLMYHGTNLRFKNLFNGLLITHLYVLLKTNIKTLADHKKWLFYGTLWRTMRNQSQTQFDSNTIQSCFKKKYLRKAKCHSTQTFFTQTQENQSNDTQANFITKPTWKKFQILNVFITIVSQRG